ncbi:hypothetical protein KUTeg_012823 [Tegillarca granosa]|uniref:Exonuclease domain-containing protein n=1 Tax=Tegillarca granosa TaxID=220873 RepID=A0ABQ9EZ75_TEGGR|nr:hypothetical protein KUTeg_012823 [Tegillarca granosa]
MKVHRCCGLVRTVWKGNGLQTSISNSFKLNKVKTFLPRHIRLKHSGTSMASLQVKMKTKVEPQLFKYFLVLDFEATCEDRKEIVPQLTGILQEMVDGKKHLDEVLQDFKEWMKENKLDEEENSFIFVTCGYQVNAFSKNTAVYPKGMMPMLRYLNLPHIGRHHSGIGKCNYKNRPQTPQWHR